MPPVFSDNGLLPAGIHSTTWDEFEQRFVYFDRSDRRFRLFETFRELYRQAKISGIVQRIYVGGSFVTSKAEPNDIDCIVVLDPSIEGHELRPTEYNLVSLKLARRVFGGDVIPVFEGDPVLGEYIGFFQKTRGGEPMGIVEIEL